MNYYNIMNYTTSIIYKSVCLKKSYLHIIKLEKFIIYKQ